MRLNEKYPVLRFTVILIGLTLVSVCFAQEGFHGRPDNKINHSPFWNDLNESQQSELQDLIQTLKSQNTDFRTIQDSIHSKLESWGIQPAEARGFHGRMPDKLNEEQKAELKSLMEQLKAGNASAMEIRQAVNDQLEAWGIEPRGPREGRGQRHPLLHGQLNDEQRTALQTLMDNMREKGATREEIHEAVRNQLDAWGIEPRGPREGRGQRHHLYYDLLNEEQRTALESMMDDMREKGATREEIHEAVRSQLDAWGIELPERPDRPDRPEKPDRSGKRADDKSEAGLLKGEVQPNPFNPETTISYSLEKTTDVHICLFNTKGQQVRELLNTTQQAGNYQIRWDGRNTEGETVPSGTYIYSIRAGDKTTNGRMIMLK
ncbi:T9SS type A sorting domain-containing protein [bacterium]|nr:T9SS type A sorting domain-containing protein [bacterium]